MAPQNSHSLRLGQTRRTVGLRLSTWLVHLGKLGQTADFVEANTRHFHTVGRGVDMVLPHHYSLLLCQTLLRTARPIHYLVSDVLSVCGKLNVLLSPLADDLLDLIVGHSSLLQITLPRRYLVLQTTPHTRVTTMVTYSVLNGFGMRAPAGICDSWTSVSKF